MRTQSHRRRSAICVTSVLSCFQSLSQLALHFSSLSCTCNLTSNAFTLAQDIVPQRKTCCTISEDSPQGEWDRIAEQMMLTFAESGHPVFRATSRLSRGQLKSKGGVKLSIHYCADPGTIETVFRTIISVNQLGIYGTVAEMCEECDSCHNRTGRPVVEGQSDPLFVPSVMKTHTFL